MTAGHGGRRWFGATMGVALVASAALFVMVNYLAGRHYRRWDWTSSQLYTLSAKTKQVLDEVVAEGKTVRVTSLLSPGFELYDSVRELLSNYAAACPNLQVESLDPAREPARAEALIRKFGLQTDRELRFVVFESGERSREVDVSELVEYDFSARMTGGPPRVRAFKGEQAFTGAILSVTQDSQTAICFTGGHGEPGLSDASPGGLSRLVEVLRTQNYRIVEWNALEGEPLAEDCALVVVAGPRRGLLDSETRDIRSHLERGGSLLALLDPELGRDLGVLPTGLESLLRDYGVEIGADVVVDRGDSRIILLGAGPETLVLSDLPPHPVTGSLGASAVILPLARSVTASEPAPPGFEVTPIARTSAEGWAERDLQTLTTGISKGEADLHGPVTVGLAVEAPAPAAGPAGGEAPAETDGTVSEPDGAPRARLLVLGDSDFARNASVSQLGNLDLALNAVGWLVEKEALIGIEPRTPEQVVLTLSHEQGNALVALVLLGLPGAAAVAGVGVWWRRRS